MPETPVRPRDFLMVEIRQAQKKLTRAKSRKDESNVRYLQARIKLLQEEMARCE